jgi:hypothetical protein
MVRLLGVLFRFFSYERRLMRAQWDVAYYTSGLETFIVELDRAQKRLAELEATRNDIRYPPPKGIA